MENKRLTLPNPETQEYGYRLAYRLACEQLARITDIDSQCQKCDARYLPHQNAVELSYLNQTCQIALSNGEVSVPGADLPLREKILVLHYFTQAKGTPLSHKLVTYQELKEGINYFPVFTKRVIKPLVSYFGKEPQHLLKIAPNFGGSKADYGDVAITIAAFPRVPVTLVLWQGDTEFAPDGNVMFDSTVPDYLTNDDIHTLCETMVWKLVRLLQTGGDSPDQRRN